YLLRKVDAGKVMGGLHEFPYLELATAPLSVEGSGTLPALLRKWVEEKLGLRLTAAPTPLPRTHHSFTRYKATLYPYLIACEEVVPLASYQWYAEASLPSCVFPSGHRSIAQRLCNDGL